MLHVQIHLDHILPESKRDKFYELIDDRGIAKVDNVLTYWHAIYESTDKDALRHRVIRLFQILAAIAGVQFRGIVVVGNGAPVAFCSYVPVKMLLSTTKARARVRAILERYSAVGGRSDLGATLERLARQRGD